MKKVLSLLTTLAILSANAAGNFGVDSPNRAVKSVVFVNDSQNLCYKIIKGGKTVLEESKMGIVIDTHKLGEDVVIELGKQKVQKSSFSWNGKKSRVNCEYISQNYVIKQNSFKRDWILETRTFNDGFAFRYVIPSKVSQKIVSELTTWKIPVDSEIWHHVNKPQYEMDWHKNRLNELKNGYNSQMPITVELAGGSYIALTEAGGFIHSGLSLKYDGSQEIKSYYRDDRKGWSVDGDIKTPWRIVMVASTLNELVNCDIVPAVCPAPDKKLFPKGSKTDWIKPGRSLWQWWGYNNGGTKWDKQRWFVDQAAALGCQYYMVDEGWEQKKQGWITKDRTVWQALKELADYAKSKNVKLLVWRSWNARARVERPGLETFEKRKEFFENCVKAGVYGAKIDFLASEGVHRRTYVRDVLKEAAQYKLMINFHGCPKPTGENRTYPNEVTREGIKGLEHNKWSTIKPEHYVTTQFTRLIAGHGDFTPTTFQPEFMKGTTAALQLASAITYTSSVLHWADKPEFYLASPAVEMIQTLPTIWDQTIVLPGSKIGELSVFARRKGQTWYVAIMNGGGARNYTLDLSFLKGKKYKATIFKDDLSDPLKLVKEQKVVSSSTKLNAKMNAAGGYVIMLKKD